MILRKILLIILISFILLPVFATNTSGFTKEIDKEFSSMNTVKSSR